MAIALSNTNTMVKQEKKYKELVLNVSTDVINVSADSLWQIARDFQNVHTWSTSVDHSTGSGTPAFEGATCSERTCHVAVKGYDRVYEKLTLFNEDKRELAYEVVEGTPGFLLFAGNHWKVVEVGAGQSKLEMEITLRLKRFAGAFLAGQMRRSVLKNVAEVCTDLKVYAETGEVSAAKKKRMLRLAS